MIVRKGVSSNGFSGFFTFLFSGLLLVLWFSTWRFIPYDHTTKPNLPGSLLTLLPLKLSSLNVFCNYINYLNHKFNFPNLFYVYFHCLLKSFHTRCCLNFGRPTINYLNQQIIKMSINNLWSDASKKFYYCLNSLSFSGAPIPLS